MLLTKLGRPPAPAAANLLRAEEALAPPATGGNGRDRYGRAPPPGKPGAAARWPGGARCPGTAGGGGPVVGPDRRVAWRKTALESARTDRPRQRPSGAGSRAGRVSERVEGPASAA
jgi:hypothetical protein